jgi:Domain of unknown function (DUF4288)
MAWVPKDAKWYLADVIEEIRVKGKKRNVVHVNTLPVRADSPEDAYKKAVKLGRRVNISYKNLAGQKVTCRFRGLKHLLVIYDKLEHGAEILYQEHVGVPKSKLRSWSKPKHRLEVFLPVEAPRGPDYAPEHIMRDLARRLKDEH